MKDLSALLAELETYGLPGLVKHSGKHRGGWRCHVVTSAGNPVVSDWSHPDPESAVRECLERVGGS